MTGKWIGSTRMRQRDELEGPREAYWLVHCRGVVHKYGMATSTHCMELIQVHEHI